MSRTPEADATLEGLSILDARAEVYRDDQGIPYIYAESLEDALRVQGFETARDRLFQMEFERRVATGRLSEIIGEAGLRSDILVRLLALERHARTLVESLSGPERAYYDTYRQGINAYLETPAEDHPPELRWLGLSPEPWELVDVITLQLFRVWSSSTNWRQELLSQQLIDRLGVERAAQIGQITVNPDDPTSRTPAIGWSDARDAELQIGAGWVGSLPASDAIGSNAWAVTGERSASGGALVASDPHIDARALPGFWHPVGLFTPELRAIGGGTPGTPGLGIGRTDHIAFAATNGYADVVDLYLELPDPASKDHYLEGTTSVPFETRTEIIRIRDAKAPGGFRDHRLDMRSTRRGPILSDHGIATSKSHLVSLRFSVTERVQAELGSRELLVARSVDEALAAIAKIPVPLTHIVADKSGRIARMGSGWLPIRTRGDGSFPRAVLDGRDDWEGWVPESALPVEANPGRQWVGSANHRIVPAGYPYAYSTHFSHSWRYRRMRSLLDASKGASVADHWRIMRDVRNELAARVVPIATRAMAADPDLASMRDVLQSWDFEDAPDSAGAAVFQSILRHFVRRVFEDDLGSELTGQLIDDPYYWQERLVRMVTDGAPTWFDDGRTPRVETRDDLFRDAARDAKDELEGRLGASPSDWHWGRLHSVTFSNPLRSPRLADRCPSGGTFPERGSGETLRRSAYRWSEPYETTFHSSMHFIADLADPDKITARIPGGVSARCASPHLEDQLGPWLAGEPGQWWFSDAEIFRHAVSKTVFDPRRKRD